jgi:hypothetical protein
MIKNAEHAARVTARSWNHLVARGTAFDELQLPRAVGRFLTRECGKGSNWYNSLKRQSLTTNIKWRAMNLCNEG